LEFSIICNIFAPRKEERTKMDKRFTPRSNEEMLAAVRAFQARQRKWFEESNKRLEKRVVEHELAV
jgi:hypothetical protein